MGFAMDGMAFAMDGMGFTMEWYGICNDSMAFATIAMPL